MRNKRMLKNNWIANRITAVKSVVKFARLSIL